MVGIDPIVHAYVADGNGASVRRACTVCDLDGDPTVCDECGAAESTQVPVDDIPGGIGCDTILQVGAADQNRDDSVSANGADRRRDDGHIEC